MRLSLVFAALATMRTSVLGLPQLITSHTYNFSDAHNDTISRSLIKREGEICGKITFYSPGVGTGSCGTLSSNGELTLALATAHWGSEQCYQSARVRHIDTDVEVVGQVRDMCPACTWTPEMEEGKPVADLSEGMFAAMGVPFENGVFQGCVTLE